MASEEHLQSFIKKIATDEKIEDFNVKIIPISSGGANYTSKLFQVKISSKDDNLHLFAKAALLGEEMRKQATIMPYDVEKFFYTKLMKTYRLLEEKHSVPEEDRLKVPKFYGVDMTYLQEILVLEDLTSRGFGSANRFESVDWEYAAAAMTELAKFHALSMTLQQENPSEFDKVLATFPSGLFPESQETEFVFDQSIASALKAVREENKEKLKQFLGKQNVTKAYNGMFEALKCNALIHVDFRPSNMLHRVTEDGTLDVIPVDYQTIQGGSPIIDLLYFIFTASDGQFRTKYYQKLVDHYYSELGVVLRRFGLDIADKYPKKDFEYDLAEKLPFGLLVAVLLLPITTMPEEQAPSMEDSVDLDAISFANTTYLYAQRLNDVVDDYVKWGIL